MNYTMPEVFFLLFSTFRILGVAGGEFAGILSDMMEIKLEI